MLMQLKYFYYLIIMKEKFLLLEYFGLNLIGYLHFINAASRYLIYFLKHFLNYFSYYAEISDHFTTSLNFYLILKIN